MGLTIVKNGGRHNSGSRFDCRREHNKNITENRLKGRILAGGCGQTRVVLSVSIGPFYTVL